MQIKSLGHVVIRVSDLERSEAFYTDVLGLPVCAHYNQDDLNMAFFSLGDHHDFAIMESATIGDADRSGLDHVAFKIGDSIEDLKAAKAHLESSGLAIEPVDHVVTKSVYISDPDGNGIELYVDVSDVWRTNPDAIAHAEPMEL
jgi:catechol 2,3-dioxygenase